MLSLEARCVLKEEKSLKGLSISKLNESFPPTATRLKPCQEHCMATLPAGAYMG